MSKDDVTDRRPGRQGGEPSEAITLREYLPYRVHLLASRIARPKDHALPDGQVVRARDWRVIVQLACHGPLTNRELATRVGLDAAGITRVVQHLLALGLVEARTPSRDRRKQIISLTAEGVSAHDRIAPVRREAGDRLLACFSPDERAVFFDMLDRLDAHIQADAEADDT